MKRFAKITFLLAFLLTTLAPAPAGAQSGARLDSLEVALWPEYDRPAMLVIYLARAAAGLQAPLTIELPIPAAVGDPHAVAAWYPDGQLDDTIEWTRSVDGEWATISATVDTTGLWVEFYMPLAVDGMATSFAYTWPGGVDVQDFSYEVMHPVGASGVQVSPQGETALDEDGMTYTRSQLGEQGSEDTLAIELSYDHASRPALQPAAPYPGNTALASLDVGLWPEYDQPQALVILQATLDPSVALPARVAVPIPSAAGDPFAVAQQDSSGQLFFAPYERELIGEYAWVVVETESSSFQVEYYTALTRQGQERSFTYFWPGGVDVGQLSYEVQHPVGAESVQVMPPGSTALDDDGLFYTRANLGPRAADDGALISFAYSKADEVLTVDAPPSIDRPATTTGSTPDLVAQLPLILAVFGGVLVAAGIVLFIRYRREERPTPARRRRRAKAASKESPGAREIEASPVYCHVCGAQAASSDRFCRRCGAELRT